MQQQQTLLTSSSASLSSLQSEGTQKRHFGAIVPLQKEARRSSGAAIVKPGTPKATQSMILGELSLAWCMGISERLIMLWDH